MTLRDEYVEEAMVEEMDMFVWFRALVVTPSWVANCGGAGANPGDGRSQCRHPGHILQLHVPSGLFIALFSSELYPRVK